MTGKQLRSRERKARRKLFVFVRDKGRCYLCGVRLVMSVHGTRAQRRAARKSGLTLMTFDHVIPKARGGTGRLDNLRACCGPCNHKKADRCDTAVTTTEPKAAPTAKPLSNKERKYAQLRAEVASLIGAS